MSGVASGSPVSASNTNQAFIDANGDDSAIGKIDFQNTDPVSGANVNNIQKNVNSLNSYTGRASNDVITALPAWVNNDVGTSSDNLHQRADSLTEKFNASAGHKHTGAAGDAPQISSSDLASVPLHGYVQRGVDLTSVTGGSTDVSAQFVTAIPSSNSTTKGVVVNTPVNRVVIRDSNGVAYISGAGDEVYGRLTYSSGVWTLTYYTLVSNVETAYSFSTSSTLQIYYQQLFNPIVDAPVYSEFAVTPSDNTTADVVDASETQAGKVYLSNVVAQPVGSTNVKGTATRVSKEDHAHQGVHSIFKTGDTAIYGDVELSPGTGVALTRVGNKITFDSTSSAVGYQEVPGGPVNGVNLTFGPLANTPLSAESCIVFVDGLPVDKSKWGLTGSSIVFTGGNAPISGQDVYVFYISSGVVIPPTPPTGTLNTEFRTITSLEAVNKIIILANTPASPGQVLVDIIGGTAQEFNVDYTVVTNEFRWNGYALDGILSSGDKLRIHYLS